MSRWTRSENQEFRKIMNQLGPFSGVLHRDRGAEAEGGLTASSRY
jgi:hypothetical protein